MSELEPTPEERHKIIEDVANSIGKKPREIVQGILSMESVMKHLLNPCEEVSMLEKVSDSESSSYELFTFRSPDPEE